MIFVFKSRDTFMKNVLLQSGWKQISGTSTTFDLKWTYKDEPRPAIKINKQFYNHFRNS